jgi:S1-C subfamily serine protease
MVRHKFRSQYLVNRLFCAALCCLCLSNPLRAAETITAEELALVKQAEAARTAIVEDVYGTVVAIYGNDRQGGGSGFLFDPAGYALTNHHVVAGAGSEGWAGLADGRLYRWQLIGTDPGGDVAIIRLSGRESFPVARLGLSDTVRVGDFVLALGNPFTLAEDQTPTVTLGIVSGIGRYQAGAGKNTLVYGNCIQIDSSVNPGNSGGPSFDRTGRAIGINGRISAMERGRVNVGVGYAISMEQIRNFIPDLLATKVVQHGTLDAQFSTRGGTVVCSALNIDSPIARAGIKLGDRLVSFNGTPIDDANVFTNLSTLYPAGWPVEVVFEHAGQERTARVRLTALPYEIQPAPEAPAADGQPPEGAPPEPAEPEAERPLGEQPKPEGDRPQPKQGDKPRVVQAPRGLQLLTQGEVRDVRLNKVVTDLLIERLRQPLSLGSDKLVLEEELQRPNAAPSKVQTVVRPGSFSLRYEAHNYHFDGERFHSVVRGTDDRPLPGKEIDPVEALANPLVLQAFVLCQMYAQTGFGKATVQLAGGDVAQKQRAYRLELKNEALLTDRTLHLWLSMFDTHGDPQVRLLKAGFDPDAAAQHPAVLFDEWREADGVLLPHRRQVAIGLGEEVKLSLVTKEVRRVVSRLGKLKEKP